MYGVKSFLAELRRRHVFRVAAWYAVAAWLVIQIATNTFPHLLLPDWTVRLVIVLCLIGFPIAIALAWALEITPEGLKVVEESARPATRSSTPPWRSISLWLALAGGILLGAGALQAWRTFAPASEDVAATKQSAPAAVPARILAVLPFENLGGDAGNAAFTAGIHDSLITRIAKIGGMTVISRTSVMAYAQNRPNLKDIAKALGVTHVVEGSVQRAGEQIRIQAQLIDAATDLHLWAESYDRTLAEGFATQNEIATAIAQELSVRLSDREREALQNMPTQNAKAFEQYVLGHAEFVRENLPKAIAHLQSAVELDPGFALAFAELSIAYTSHAAVNAEMSDVHFAAARQAFEQALALKPGLAEGVLARGAFHYIGSRDFAAAEPDLSYAAAQLPNSYLAQSFLGYMRRRQGRWLEAVELLERAAAIEPADMGTMWSLAQTYSVLRQRDAIERATRRAQAADPEKEEPGAFQARLLLKFDGDLAGMVAALERLHAQFPQGENTAFFLYGGYEAQGRFQDAATLLESNEGSLLDIPGLREMLIGWAYREAKDIAAASRWFEASLSQSPAKGSERSYEDQAYNSVIRAWSLEGLGRASEASVLLQDALAVAPRNKDELAWCNTASLAFTLLGRMGDTQGALDLAAQLLEPPSVYTPYDVWFHWAAAPLRANPEFRELMARHGVDVTRDPRAHVVSQQSVTGQSN